MALVVTSPSFDDTTVDLGVDVKVEETKVVDM
jgi:hypothetical protein